MVEPEVTIVGVPKVPDPRVMAWPLRAVPVLQPLVEPDVTDELQSVTFDDEPTAVSWRVVVTAPTEAVPRSAKISMVLVVPGASVKSTEKLFAVDGLIGVEPEPDVSEVRRFERL